MDRPYQNLPVFQKAEEIMNTTLSLVEVLGDDPMSEMMTDIMRGNAMTIPAKIVGAASVDDYVLNMENAVIIKIAARELRASLSMIEVENKNVTDYTNLLRKEIDEFRELFLEWVATFDKLERWDDGWGIFTEGASPY